MGLKATLQKIFGQQAPSVTPIIPSEEMKETLSDLNHFEILAPERPPQVLREIGNVYSKIIEQPLTKLGFSTHEDYYFSYYDFSGFNSIVKFCNQSKKKLITVLIIGTGDKTFAKKLKGRLSDKVSITILAPISNENTDHVDETTEPDEITYVAGNAEHFYTLFSTNTFDVILSADVFYNFFDPLGTIQQLYQALMPGGIMIIDEFYLYGIHDQLPTLLRYLNDTGCAVIADYTFGIQNKILSIEGVRCFMAKKTLPQLTIPGVIYSGIHEDSDPTLKNYIIYVINPPLPSFKKEISAQTEAFIRFVHKLIPSISEKIICQFLFNTYIMNNRFNRQEKNAYEKALQTSLLQLFRTYNVSDATQKEQIQQALYMTKFVAEWIDQTRNREEFIFFVDILRRIGVDISEKD